MLDLEHGCLGDDVLKQSVYDSVLLQTRFKPYLDAVELTVTEAVNDDEWREVA